MPHVDEFEHNSGFVSLPDESARSKDTKRSLRLLVDWLVVLAVLGVLFVTLYNNFRTGESAAEWECVDSCEVVFCEETVAEPAVEEAFLPPIPAPDYGPEAVEPEEVTAAAVVPVEPVPEEAPVAPKEERKAGAYRAVLKGGFTSENDFYPIELSFAVKDGRNIENCIYHNVRYGSKIPMRGMITADHFVLLGKDGSRPFTIDVQMPPGGFVQGAMMHGISTDGKRKLNVELTLGELIEAD